jgi:hypothetical protein
MAKEEMSMVEKMRRAIGWLDYLDEKFNDNFKSADDIIKVWEEHECDNIDDLWADLEPDSDGWVDPDVINDAKMVNKAFGFDYYEIPNNTSK